MCARVLSRRRSQLGEGRGLVEHHDGRVLQDGARERDARMSDARRRMDWEEQFSLAIDSVRPRKVFESAPPENEGTCTMCGKMCAVRTVNKIMDGLVIDLDNE